VACDLYYFNLPQRFDKRRGFLYLLDLIFMFSSTRCSLLCPAPINKRTFIHEHIQNCLGIFNSKTYLPPLLPQFHDEYLVPLRPVVRRKPCAKITCSPISVCTTEERRIICSNAFNICQADSFGPEWKIVFTNQDGIIAYLNELIAVKYAVHSAIPPPFMKHNSY
jgi:hypothetical protein